jgi:hypothetical protein
VQINQLQVGQGPHPAWFIVFGNANVTGGYYILTLTVGGTDYVSGQFAYDGSTDSDALTTLGLGGWDLVGGYRAQTNFHVSHISIDTSNLVLDDPGGNTYTLSLQDSGSSTGQGEVDTISVIGATGGTFTLQVNGGDPTPPIPYNATAAQIEAKFTLNWISTSCHANGPVDNVSEYPVQVAFINESDDQPIALTADDSELVGASDYTATTQPLTLSFLAPTTAPQCDAVMRTVGVTLRFRTPRVYVHLGQVDVIGADVGTLVC